MPDSKMRPPADVSVQLIRALQNVWNAIRTRHQDVPGVVLLPSPAAKKNVLGHFAPLRWEVRAVSEGSLLHEVVLVAEYMNRGAEDVVETLLHEAAHAMNFSRGLKDCSASQYHNKRFKVAAEELGLEVMQVRHYGYAYTTLSNDAKALYERVTTELDSVLIHRRGLTLPSPPPGTTGAAGSRSGNTSGTTRASRSRKATCSCGFIIRVSRKTFTDTVIRCDSCGEPFTLA